MDASVQVTRYPAALARQPSHHEAYPTPDAKNIRLSHGDIVSLPLALCHPIESDPVPGTGERCPHMLVYFCLQDGAFIAFFDPDGARLALSADVASASQLERASIDNRAGLDVWPAHKAQWRQEHQQGLATGSLKTRHKGRAEVSAWTTSLQENRGTA